MSTHKMQCEFAQYLKKGPTVGESNTWITQKLRCGTTAVSCAVPTYTTLHNPFFAPPFARAPTIVLTYPVLISIRIGATPVPNIPLRLGGTHARIAVIPGDGIGKEVTPVAVNVIKAATAKHHRHVEFVEFDWGADKFLREKITLPDGAVEMLRDEFDAILFGALGDPRVPSNQHAADILLGLRFKLDLYVNARPTELFHERFTPLKDRIPNDIRMMVFRENTEGVYTGAGGFFKKETPDEIATRRTSTPAKGSERILRFAFNCCRGSGLNAHPAAQGDLARRSPSEGGSASPAGFIVGSCLRLAAESPRPPLHPRTPSASACPTNPTP